MAQMKLIEVMNLSKLFIASKSIFSRKIDYIRAVNSVNIFVLQGETLGLVGESGCGKTTLGRCVIRLDESTSGQVLFGGEDIHEFDHQKLHNFRKEVQIIFQDPYSSLNPRKTIGSIVEEPLIVHGLGNKRQRRSKVSELMEIVGLRPEHYNRYPHEFSGGQRQRIGIARALILRPKFVVCDEPVSALDVSIRSQIINLIEDLQKELGLTYLFISHDLSVIEHISDRVAVMYLGQIVELASSSELYTSPYHPYTEALLSASPIPDPLVKRKRILLKGEIPSSISPPGGCYFSTRCPAVVDKCLCDPPPPWEEFKPDHWVRCWRTKEIYQNFKANRLTQSKEGGCCKCQND